MSSSGSGVATAAGLCFAAIGTDTGGSIRNPASANGVVGLKPTYGRVSRYGVLAMAPSLDHVGPMARTVADAAIMFDAIAGFDPQDSTSLNEPPSNVLGQTNHGIKNLRIGLDRTYALKDIDSGQAAALENAIKVLESLGTQIVDVKMPNVADVVDTWMPICASEMASAHAANYPSRASEYGPYLREFLESGLHVTPQQLSAATEFSRRNDWTCGRRSGMADYTRVAGGADGSVPRGLVRSRTAKFRVHHADGPRRRARDLSTVWVRARRRPLQRSVHRAAAE
jgi:amidase